MNGLTMLRVTVCLALTVLVEFCLSAVPPVLNYQGRLVDSLGTPLDGNHSFRLAIYDSELGGSEVWSETQDVTVADGMFSVLLGSANPLSESVFSSGQRWLGIRLGSGPEFVPRKRLTTSPFAFRSGVAETAAVANSVADNSITSDKIVDGQVHNAEIGIGAVDSNSILNQSVSQNDLADSSVATAKIARSAITSVKIQDGTIVSADISDQTISAADIASGAVGTDEIAANSITSVKIVDGGVSSTDILNGTINSDDLGTNSVGSSEIAPDAVSAGKIIDEPGVAQNVHTNAPGIDITSTTTINLLSRSITCPTAGYVIAFVSCNTYILGGANRGAELAISDISATMPLAPIMTVGVGVFSDDASYKFPFATQRIFNVSSGAHTFYFVGRIRTNYEGDVNVAQITLDLLFVPTAYGTVTGAAMLSSSGAEDETSSTNNSASSE